MKKNVRMLMSIFWMILGIVLCACYALGLIEDFWNSMGFAFIVVGILQVIRHIRYRTNKGYQEKMDIEAQDERNKFISNKAWAWAGYFFVLAAACGTIAFKLLGKEELMMFCSGSVCFFILVYWLCWLWLKRKY